MLKNNHSFPKHDLFLKKVIVWAFISLASACNLNTIHMQPKASSPSEESIYLTKFDDLPIELATNILFRAISDKKDILRISSVDRHWKAIYDRIIPSLSITVKDKTLTPDHLLYMGQNPFLSLTLDQCTLPQGENSVQWLFETCKIKHLSIQLAFDKERTPLYWALTFEKEHSIKQLIQEGSDVNTITKKGLTALSWGTKKGDIAFVEMLFSKGGLATIIDKEMEYLFKNAMLSKNVDMVALILNKYKPKTFDQHTIDSAFISAAQFQDSTAGIDILDLLLKNGANINEKTARGYTALHNLAFQGHNFQIADYLLKHEADIHSTNNHGDTIICTALENKYTTLDLLRVLESAGVVIKDIKAELLTKALYNFINEDKVEIVKFLLERGAQVNLIPEILNVSPLRRAAFLDKMEMVKILLNYGATIDLTKKNDSPKDSEKPNYFITNPEIIQLIQEHQKVTKQ